MNIFAAVSDGDVDAAKEILALHPELARSYEAGSTPLHLASQKGYGNIAEALIFYGADVTAEDRNGCQPLHCAASEGHHNVAEVLIAGGADVDCRISKDGGLLGSAPLHLAASGGYTKVMVDLIANGADVNARSDLGWSPLHFTVQQNQKQAAELLIEAGADVNVRDAKNQETSMPLALATWLDRTEIAQLLSAHGAKQPSLLPLAKAGCGVLVVCGLLAVACLIIVVGT